MGKRIGNTAREKRQAALHFGREQSIDEVWDEHGDIFAEIEARLFGRPLVVLRPGKPTQVAEWVRHTLGLTPLPTLKLTQVDS